MGKTRVIGLVGSFAAGAGTTAAALSELLGAPVGGLADKLRGELRSRGIPVVRENLRKFANELCSRDPRALGKLVIADFEKQPEKPFFVAEPIRRMGDYRAFKERYGGDFILLAVDAPIELRYQRSLLRKREGEERQSFEEFKEGEEKEGRRDAKESEQNIPALISLADYLVVNDGTPEELREKLKSFLKQYGLLE